MYIISLICMVSSLAILYLKYRVLLTGEKCKAKIIDIADKNCGYSIRGTIVKKHSYIVKINRKKYYTAHGCLFISWGKKKIGKEIVVYKNEKYGKEVYKHPDFRIEIIAFILLLLSVFLFTNALI